MLQSELDQLVIEAGPGTPMDELFAHVAVAAHARVLLMVARQGDDLTLIPTALRTQERKSW